VIGSCGDGFCSLSEMCKGGNEPPPNHVTTCFEDCGECDVSHTLAAAQCSAAATGLTAAHNASLLWGTYRPHLFHGIRTRSSKPVLVGVMWHSPTSLDPLRYETTSNGMKTYGWLRHDGRSFGHQKIVDTDLGIEMDSHFIKSWPAIKDDGSTGGDGEGGEGGEWGQSAPNGGGDWALRLKVGSWAAGKGRRGGSKASKVSVVLHVATLGKKAVLTKPTLGGGAPLASATFSGYNPSTGRFAVSVFGRGKVGEVVEASYFGAQQKREHMEQADDVLKQVYRYAQQQEGSERRFLSLPNEIHDEAKANSLFVQVTVPVGGEVDIIYNSFLANKIGDDEGPAKLLLQAQHKP
jgi:hypothetical protein